VKLIVSNTGPILHLFEAQALDLLAQAGDIRIPVGVEQELRQLVNGWQQPTWIKIDALTNSRAADAAAWQQAGLFGIGEAQAIALALQNNTDWFLTDDAAARLMAQTLGLEVHGSLGIVLWAAANKNLSHGEANAAIERLAHSSLWVSERVLAHAKTALDQLFQE
jgi:predicted nucleic acid-binding protein